MDRSPLNQMPPPTSLFPIKRFLQLLLFLALLLGTFYIATSGHKRDVKEKQEVKTGVEFRVMTFNTWIHGRNVNNGLEKIAKHIKAVNPDVVVLQEIQRVSDFDNLLDILGPGWNGAFRAGSRYLDDAVISRHEFNYTESFPLRAGVGIEVKIENKTLIRVVGLHLDWHNFQSYAATNKLVTDKSQLLIGEKTPPIFNRVEQMEELLEHQQFKRWMEESEQIPILVGGDFNTPSHLDWTEDRKHDDGHGGWAVEWPTTKLIMDAGFLDSFRVKHPDPKTMPGNSWSLVQKYNLEYNWTILEPQDRIDFIFFKGQNLRVKDSYLYSGDQPAKSMPDHKENDFPSDHYALVSDFYTVTSKGADNLI